METKAASVVHTQFKEVENDLTMKFQKPKVKEGVELDESEQAYLLPHFLMLLVGKPGSGKTATLKQLLTNKKMYYQKFDYVFLISPSHAKMGIKVKPENVRDKFDLDWIFEQVEKVNAKQVAKQAKLQHDHGGEFQAMYDLQLARKNRTKHPLRGTFEKKPRFITNELLSMNTLYYRKGLPVTDEDRLLDDEKRRLEEQKQQLSPEQQRSFYANVLFVFDDVIGDIKRQENNPRLAQLVMNRRHLIHNGMVSICVVTQKYTLIPSRLRSNATWLILFKLNPRDFLNVYEDAITMSPKQWEALLAFIFGADFDEGAQMGAKEEDDGKQGQMSTIDAAKKRTKTSLGVWVEFNVYFRNFKQIVPSDYASHVSGSTNLSLSTEASEYPRRRLRQPQPDQTPQSLK